MRPFCGGNAVATAIWSVLAVLLAGCSPPGPAPPEASRGDELAAAVDAFVEQSLAPGMANRRAILVAVDGTTVVERYYDSSAGESATVASVTKSIVSTLVGIAVSDGDLTLDQTLSELLPSYAGIMSAQVGAITLAQLLTMTAGLPADVGPDQRPHGDWVATILHRGTVQPPGEAFAYSSVTSHLLAAILVEKTGRPLLAYARDKLFDPLRIDTRPAFQPTLEKGTREPRRAYDRAGFAWPRDPQGINMGGGYLKMTAPDMLRLGNLFLDGGSWDGEQLVSREWVEDATHPAVSTGGQGGGNAYGFQWWVTTAGDHPAYAAIGYGGQIIEVVPDLDLVVVASTWLDDIGAFDSRTWEQMVSLSLVPVLEPDTT